jgi:hypothetical protein
MDGCKFCSLLEAGARNTDSVVKDNFPRCDPDALLQCDDDSCIVKVGDGSGCPFLLMERWSEV